MNLIKTRTTASGMELTGLVCHRASKPVLQEIVCILPFHCNAGTALDCHGGTRVIYKLQ